MTILGRGDLMPPRRPHGRSGRRRTVAAAAGLVLVAAGGYLGWREFADSNSPAPTIRHCHTPTAAVAPAVPGAVRLRVVNTTLRTGLAARTRTALRHRGFHVVGIGNGHAVASETVIRYPRSEAAAARALAEQFAHPTLQPTSGHGPLVLEIGKAYPGLVTTSAASRARQADERAAHPQQICTDNPN